MRRIDFFLREFLLLLTTFGKHVPFLLEREREYSSRISFNVILNFVLIKIYFWHNRGTHLINDSFMIGDRDGTFFRDTTKWYQKNMLLPKAAPLVLQVVISLFVLRVSKHRFWMFLAFRCWHWMTPKFCAVPKILSH